MARYMYPLSTAATIREDNSQSWGQLLFTVLRGSVQLPSAVWAQGTLYKLSTFCGRLFYTTGCHLNEPLWYC